VRAYLIDPSLHRVSDIELRDGGEQELLKDIHNIIGAEWLDHCRISDRGDELWCDDQVLARGGPCFAFRLRGEGPFGGKCIIIGNDRHGNARAPVVPLAMIENDCDFLDEIVPQVFWVEEQVERFGKKFTAIKSVITYSRCQKK